MPPHDDDADAVEYPIEDHIDLHPFSPKEVPDVVSAYLEAAREEGLTEVRVIHGRGTGFQRERVRRLLESHADVAHFESAPAERGGWGATIVWLRPRER